MSQIITIQDLGDYFGKDLTNDARATDIVNSVNAWVEAYTGRVFGEIKTITETFDYEPVLFLGYVDIHEITSVKAFGETLSQAQYKVSKDTGRLLLGSGLKRPSKALYDAVEVVYTTGIDTVPADLKTAALQVASDNYNRTDNAEGKVASESVGGYSVAYREQGTGSSASSTGLASGTQSAIGDPMAVLNFYRIRGM